MAYSHDGISHPTPEQGPSSLRLTLELSDLTTWADLRRFVALGSRLPDETPLDLAYTHQGDLDGLVVYVDNTGGW